MTLGLLIYRTALAVGLFSLWKLIYFGWFNQESFVLLILFYIGAAIIAIAIVRRVGVLNYLENFFVLIVWLVFGVAVDWLIVGLFLDPEVRTDWHFWLSYLVIIFASLLFHKKRHVEIRKGNI